jgi:hypothetical protein
MKLISTQRRWILSRLMMRLIPSCATRGLEQQDREEVPALMGHQPPHQPAAVPGRSFGCEGDRGQRDVGVGSHLVRVRVVAVVLALPPAVAHPDQQVRDDQADPVVPPSRLEDLTVRGVMAQERDLGHQNREDSGVGELPPAVADPDETHDPGGQDENGTDQLGPVVAVARRISPISGCCGQRVKELPDLHGWATAARQSAVT